MDTAEAQRNRTTQHAPDTPGIANDSTAPPLNKVGGDGTERVQKSAGADFAGVTTRRGRAATPEYTAWINMRARCEKPSLACYRNYGGRGIAVCDRWRSSFDAFYEDMGPRPSCRHSLDRIDVNGNYEPGNCRWATTAEQSRNRRDNVRVEYDGNTLTLAEWSEQIGVSRATLTRRYAAGLPPSQILAAAYAAKSRSETIREGWLKRSDAILLTFQGETLTLTAWARRIGVSRRCLRHRLAAGWPIELALTEPANAAMRLARRAGIEVVERVCPVECGR